MNAYKSKPDNMEGLSSLIQQRFTLSYITPFIHSIAQQGSVTALPNNITSWL